MTLPELDQKIARFEARIAQLQRDLTAAKAFREAFPRIMAEDEAPHSIVPIPNTPHMIAADSTNGSATSAIKKAIEKCGATYTLNDVEKAVTDAGGNLTRTQISQALSRLAKDSAIRIQTPGQGRRPTIFTKEVPTS